MKMSLREVLACPVCQGSLEFEGTSSDSRMVKGILRCSKGHLYQVKDEIPILKDPKLSEKEFEWKVEFPNVEKYDRIREKYASYLPKELIEADRAMINKMVEICSKERLLLDVASGMGSLLLALSKRFEKGKNILGTDIDEKPLLGAKLKLEEQKSYDPVSLCVMDAKHLAIKPQKISCVTSFFGLDNIPETKKAFQEVYRVLTTKGRLVMATLWLKENSKSLALAEELDVGAIATENRLTQTFEEIGFKINFTKKFYSGEWPYNPMDALPLEGDWFAQVLVVANKN